MIEGGAMKRIFLRLSVLAGTGSLCLSLSGCFAPLLIPLVYGGMAVGVVGGSFVAYKTVQTAGGGKVVVAFASADKKKSSPPKPLPTAEVAGIWSGTEREKKFAQTLETAGVMQVVSLREDLLPAAPEARAQAYEHVCGEQKVDQIFSAVDGGETVKSGALSFGRGGVTHALTLESYGCAEHKVVWTDSMSVTVQAGNGTTPQNDVDDIAGQAWGERVLEARNKGVAQTPLDTRFYAAIAK
jgi:hypothetical protein